MAIAKDYIKYQCDRCGKTEYIVSGGPLEKNWQEITRWSWTLQSASRWLDRDCFALWQTFAQKQDNEFTAFMNPETKTVEGAE